MWERCGRAGLRVFRPGKSETFCHTDAKLEKASRTTKKGTEKWCQTLQSRYAGKVPPCLCAVNSNVAEKWINAHCAMGKKYSDNIGGLQKTLHSWWKKRVACPAGRSWFM